MALAFQCRNCGTINFVREETMKVFVLGPALELVVEPEPSPVPPSGRMGIEFGGTPTQPGGIVNVRLVRGDGAMPVNVYACFVSPPDSVPPKDSRTPDWFFGCGCPIGSAPVHADSTDITIQVPGVEPGAYFVQTICEYDE